MTQDEKDTATKAKADAKSQADADKAKIVSDKAAAKENDTLTFPQKIDKLRGMGYMIGREDATGSADAVNARQTTPTEGKLTVIRDGWKYSINLDEITKSGWPTQAKIVGDVLGVTFDVKDLQPDNQEDPNVKKAQDAANVAHGTFVPNKKP